MQEYIPLKDINTVAPEEIGELDLYQKREKIYTRSIQGFFQKIRLFTGWPLLLGYFLLPWINWNGQQSILFDLPERKFHIFTFTFWPQEFVLLSWVLIIAAFALFLFTTLFGRIWCGYSCPQTVWTTMFMWAEQKTEGSRNQRIKLDKLPMSWNKFIRKSLKHGIWLSISIYTAYTFVGFFVPIRELVPNLLTLEAAPWTYFWVLFFTAATYINAGWMREQVCLYMCPYARFQSTMFDSNTLTVSYDAKRGEPRGSRKKNIDTSDIELGSCVDCQLCVQVCPTGIDIRDGLQVDCIGCALCIDACNSIMDQMDYRPDLISYASENKLQGKAEQFWRPKVFLYGAALILMCTLFVGKLAYRVPLAMDIIRDRQELYIETADNKVENNYLVKILNMDQRDHIYYLDVQGLAGLTIIDNQRIYIESGGIEEIPVRLSIAKEAISRPNHTIVFHVESRDDIEISAEQESRFLSPSTLR